MQTVLPREEAVEGVISKVLESQEACDRLNEVFYEHLENYQEINDDGDRHFAEVLLQAYKNGDVSALLLELCGKGIFITRSSSVIIMDLSMRVSSGISRFRSLRLRLILRARARGSF